MSHKISIRWILIPAVLCLLLATAAGAQDTVSGSSVPPRPDPLLTSGGEEKIIVGAKEMAYFPAPGVFLVARIDSGAAYSSIHASDISHFNKDGDEWVRFNLDFDGKDRVMERPLEDLVLIRQSGSAGVFERPVVPLDVRLGTYSLTLSFSLADRRHMTFPVLLGRDFLYDRALVDVSSTYLMSSH